LADRVKVRRVRFFRHAVNELGDKPLELEVIQSKIHEWVLPLIASTGCQVANYASRFVHQHDEEYEEEKKTRRAGRPSSTKEDLLKMKITALEKEYRDGFCKWCTQRLPGPHQLTASRYAGPKHRTERRDGKPV
jgi:translation machinery-associated protein 16